MKYIYIIILFCFISWHSFAQSPSLAGSYLAHYGNQAALYYGREQLKYPLTISGHPYWGQSNYVKAKLLYNDILYDDVLVKIDMYRKELIVQSPNPPYNVVLENSRIGYIRINDTTIVYLNAQISKKQKPQGNFFIIHKGGKFQVLERQTVQLTEEKDNTRIQQSFVRKSDYFVYDGNAYYKLKNKTSLKKIFKNKKDLISKYVHEHKPDFKTHTGEAFSAVIKFIENK